MFWELNSSDAGNLARKTGGILFIQPAWLSWWERLNTLIQCKNIIQ